MQDVGDRAFYTVFCDLWPASLFRCATASLPHPNPHLKLVFNVTLVSGACNNIVLLLNKIFYSSQGSSLQLTLLLLLTPRKIKAICVKPIWNWGSNKTWSFIMLFIIQNAVREPKNKLLSFMSIVCVTKRKKANDHVIQLWTVIYLWFCPPVFWEPSVSWPKENSVGMIPEASQFSLLPPLGEVDEQPSLDLKWSEFSYRHAVPVQLSWELL